MRSIALLLAAGAIIAILPAAGAAQEGDRQSASAATPGAAVPSYVVQLTVFRLKAASDPGMTAGDIVQSFEQLKKDDKLDLLETVRLSTLAGHESRAQFGKIAVVTMSEKPTQFGIIRDTKRKAIGTLARLTAEPHGEKVTLKLAFEASRFEGEEREDSPPSIGTTAIETTLLLEPGKPTLVGGFGTKTTSADGAVAEETWLLLASIARN